MSNSLRPHELQYTRPSCPSPTPRVYSDSRPVESVMPSSHLILCRPLLLLPPIPPSIRVFSSESALHNGGQTIGAQHQSFWWIFRADFLSDGLVWSPCSPRDSQESSPTPQFKSINFWCSAFFIVQLSYPYMTTGKTIALSRWTFVGKVMSLLLNMLSRLVITFLPRSKNLSISGVQSPSAAILEPPKIKSFTVSTVSPSILPWSSGTGCRDHI